jgi:FeS assembly SUF system protein
MIMEVNNFLQLEAEIVRVLKNIFDPEIPVNIYDLGLIYEVDVDDNNWVTITMTLTAPNCPMADDLIAEVHQGVKGIEGVKEVKVNLVFDPPWDKSMMSEEAKLELGLL